MGVKVMKALKKIIAVVLVVATCLSVLAGCGSKSTDVLKIDGKPVSYELYRYYYLNLKYQYDSGNQDFWKNNNYAKEQLKQEAVYYIKRDIAIDMIAAANNITLDEEDMKEVDSTVEEIKAMLGGEDKYNEFLKASYTDADMYYEMIKRDTLGQKIWDKLYGKDGTEVVSDDEMKNIIEKEYVRAVHVLVTFETDNAKEIAADIAETAKKGADFMKLVEKYGEDPGMEDNADGYYFTKGEMVKAFEECAFALKEGEISDPVVTSYGYHVIKRLPMEEKYINENLDDIRSSYYNIKTSSLIQEYIDGLETEELSQYKKIDIDMQ